MLSIIKKTWWLMALSAFLCFVNIDKTYLLIQDTARDSVKMIEIWQNKELTLIGPPASLGQRTEKEFFLGSLAYYMGIIGFLVTGFQAWGAIIVQVLIFVTSIPVSYLFFKNSLKLKRPILGTLLYVISPLTMTHLRFYWNPNAIIGFSMWFWFLVSNRNIKGIYLVVAGIILGFIFNLHYFAAFPLFLWTIYLFVSGKFKRSLMILFGFVVGSGPIWVFELRNNFYLSKTFLFDLTNRFVGQTNFGEIIEGLWRFPAAILGIRPMEINYGVIFDPTWQKILGWTIFCLMLFTVLKAGRKIKILFGVLVLASLVTAILSGNGFYGRYLFGLYPIFIWLVAITIEKIGWIGIIMLVPIIFADLKIIAFRPNPSQDYVDIKTLETASQIIKDDVKGETYNLSENIYGDAQAMGLRFYVLKNVKNKPKNELSYEHLDSLYVLNPSLDKTLKDNRYEYSASNLSKVSWEKDIGSVKLYKFVRKN